MSSIDKKLMHYMTKAIHDYRLINKGDRVMVCLSGGKDSYTLLTLLNRIKHIPKFKFELFSYTLDQTQPGWDDQAMRAWLKHNNIPFEIEQRDTYSVVKEKIPEGKTYCSLCSRLRRGNIYRYAKEHGFNKVALGHHRDDLIQTLFLSMCYSGQIKSMPPKLKSDDEQNTIIRPLVYCQEKDILAFSTKEGFPIIPCTLCGSQETLHRKKMKQLLDGLAKDNPKVPSNILHALKSVQPSHLMDKSLWNFVD